MIGVCFSPALRPWDQASRAGPAQCPWFVAVDLLLGSLEHDPEKWEPVFRKDHAQTRDQIMMRFNLIAS